jgi:propanol-preferring alcohol dehydrogenase
MASLPAHQRAAIKQGEGKDARAPVQNIPIPVPGPGQILVKINWTGLCASDKSLLHDEWAGFGLKMSMISIDEVSSGGLCRLTCCDSGLNGRYCRP